MAGNRSAPAHYATGGISSLRPRSGRSSMRMKRDQAGDQAHHPEREHTAEDMREIDAERVCRRRAHDGDVPPRSGATPSVASRMAPMTATMNAAVSPRKKFIAPMAAPT